MFDTGLVATPHTANDGLLKLADLDKAIADYNAVMKVNPKAAGSLYGRGVAKNMKQAGSCDADLAAAKALDTKIAETLSGYGVK